MPFPFLPGGVLLAIAVLGGALTVFGLVLRAMDTALTAGRRSMLPGLVSGLRTWAEASPPELDPPAPAIAIDLVELIELDRHRIPDDEPRA
jgi:hypothetical protein